MDRGKGDGEGVEEGCRVHGERPVNAPLQGKSGEEVPVEGMRGQHGWPAGQRGHGV